MKYLNGEYYVEVKDRFKIHPFESFILRRVQSETQIMKKSNVKMVTLVLMIS